MVIFPMAKVSFIMNLVMWVWVLVAVALILIILLQKGRGGGLSGAFGGAGGASSLLGAKTGDFLTWVTIALITLFLFLAVIMAKFYRPKVSDDLQAPAPTVKLVEQGSETIV